MMLLLATGLLSACTSAVPFCLGTWSLVLLLCLMGLNMGAMDNLSNIAMLKLYGSYSAPFLQVRARAVSPANAIKFAPYNIQYNW